MVKPILETNDANDVSMYVWFIHSCMKRFKKDTMFGLCNSRFDRKRIIIPEKCLWPEFAFQKVFLLFALMIVHQK